MWLRTVTMMVVMRMISQLSVLMADEGLGYDEFLARRLGADDYGMRAYMFVLLKTGPADVRDEAKRQELFEGHMANIVRLTKERKITLAGPFTDEKRVLRGLFVLDTGTVDEARALVESDPAVAAGVFTYEIIPWYGSAALMTVNTVHAAVAKKSF